MNALIAQILAQDSKGGGLSGLVLPLLLLGPLMYMMIVPQRKQRKKAAEMLASLKVGDEVVTSGGIHGVINFLDDSVAHVEVDTDVVIRISKSALNRVTGGDHDSDETEPTPAEIAAEDTSSDSSADSKK